MWRAFLGGEGEMLKVGITQLPLEIQRKERDKSEKCGTIQYHLVSQTIQQVVCVCVCLAASVGTFCCG